MTQRYASPTGCARDLGHPHITTEILHHKKPGFPPTASGRPPVASSSRTVGPPQVLLIICRTDALFAAVVWKQTDALSRAGAPKRVLAMCQEMTAALVSLMALWGLWRVKPEGAGGGVSVTRPFTRRKGVNGARR